MISGGGVLKLQCVQVVCPACGQQVKGYCAVAKQYVDCLIETQRVRIGKHLTSEHRAKISVALEERQKGVKRGRGFESPTLNNIPLVIY